MANKRRRKRNKSLDRQIRITYNNNTKSNKRIQRKQKRQNIAMDDVSKRARMCGG